MLVLPQTWAMFGMGRSARSALHGLGVAPLQRELRYGDRGFDVAYLQEQLVRRGYTVGSAGVDGQFGRSTEGAVRRFQSDVGVTPTGVVDRASWNVLFGSDSAPTVFAAAAQASKGAMVFEPVTIYGRTPERAELETPAGSPTVVIERLARKLPTWAWVVGGVALGGVALALVSSRRR